MKIQKRKSGNSFTGSGYNNNDKEGIL